MTTDPDKNQFGPLEMPDPVPDDVIDAISRTIPEIKDPSLRADFPKLMQAWFRWHRMRHGKSGRDMEAALKNVAKRARALDRALSHLDSEMLVNVAWFANPTPPPSDRMFSSEGVKFANLAHDTSARLADCLENALKTHFKRNKGGQREPVKTQVAFELAEIFHYLTRRKPTLANRSSDVHDDELAGPYGAYLSFVSKVFEQVFGETRGDVNQARRAIALLSRRHMTTNGCQPSWFIVIRQLLEEKR